MPSEVDTGKSRVTVEDKKKSGVTMEEDKKKSRAYVTITSKSSTKSLAPGLKSMSRMKVRRQSFGFSGISGIKNVETSSQIAFEFKRPILAYLNTYQLDPSVRFDTIKATKAANELMDEYFTEYKYNKEEAPALALQIAGQLMRAVKALNFNRYRIISVVTIGQKRAQSYSNAITFLWDHERDNYISIYKELRTAFVQITVFGIYLD